MSLAPLTPRVLCQPDASKSCGSCCGMYNARDAGPEVTPARLLARTRAFFGEADVTDAASLKRFRARWQPRPEDKLLDGLPSCPFLGLLDHDPARPDHDARAGKVGCLIHPTRHGGLDQRDCGVYDRHICQDYLCAAHTLLREEERRLVLDAVQDSYLYGLIITDVRFVRELFALAAHLNAMSPPVHTLRRARVVEAARDFFALKRGWPYAGASGIFGAVVPLRGLETARRQGPSARLGVAPDLSEQALTCLGTEVDDLDALTHARQLVWAAAARFARAVALDQDAPAGRA